MNKLSPLLIVLLFITACGGNDDNNGNPEVPTNFDRGAMLESWVNDGFLPRHRAFATATRNLEQAARDNEGVAEAFRDALTAWQLAAPYATGPSEQNFQIRRTNTFPTNVAQIRDDISEGREVSRSDDDAVGLPALEYLIFADEARETGRIVALAAALADQAAVVADRWEGDFRADYAGNSGNGANSSVDRTVNDVINYYERDFRAGKIGIPAGVFSATPLPDRAELLYLENGSREQFLAGLGELRRFIVTGDNSLADYLDALDVNRSGEPLSALISTAFDEVRTEAEGLDAVLANQVRTDNSRMLATYDALQRLLVLLKVDMMQALNINVDYVDADGD